VRQQAEYRSGSAVGGEGAQGGMYGLDRFGIRQKEAVEEHCLGPVSRLA
jgi:hypothetical protein